MKLSVTGSKHWFDRKSIYEVLNNLPIKPTVIIHGGAEGVDSICAEWAFKNDVHCAVIRPINPTIKSDYLNRNKIVVDLGDYTLAFRETGKSNGTDFTIAYALSENKLHPKSIIKGKEEILSQLFK